MLFLLIVMLLYIPLYCVSLILHLSCMNVGFCAIVIWYTIWFSKAQNILAPGMIDRLTCCAEPKRSLEAGAFCVKVPVLLAVIHGAKVVLVLHSFECSHTPMSI